MNKINENTKVTLTLNQLKDIVEEAWSGDDCDKVVKAMRRCKAEYGERGVAKFLIDAFGTNEILSVLNN